MTGFDVLARSAAIIPDKAGAEAFTFLPYHRTGAAAGIRSAPFAVTAAARATVTVSFSLSNGSRSAPVSQTVTLRGPGDVTGIDPAQIIRRHPVPGTGNAPTGDLVHVEFDAPDLPWMFTPASPVDGRLHPWIRLVVVEKTSIVRELPPAGPDLPPGLRLRRSDLPPPDDAWAWAHAQVSGEGLAADEIAGHLGLGAPQLNLSRLVSPRRLEPGKTWVALVVPAFKAGAAAGLRLPAVDTLAWAWSSAETDEITLPVYDRWEFATGEALGFEELAEKVVEVPAPAGLGRRWVDTAAPGLGILPEVDQPRAVHGALTAPTDSGLPPDSPDGSWDAAATEALRRIVDPSAPDGDPEVGPPLYGGAHLLADRVPTAEPAWLAQLNLDPEQRIAAALGAAVVQQDQEPLMAGAWSQLQNVRAANAVLRAGQFSRVVQAALHRRTIDRMGPGDLLATTTRAHAQLDGADQTVRGAVAASALPLSAESAPLRRLARPLGRTARHAPADERSTALERLIADGDLGTDWTVPVPGVQHSSGGALVDLIEQGQDLSRLGPPTSDDAMTAALAAVIASLPTVDEFLRMDSAGRLSAASAMLRSIALGREMSHLSPYRWQLAGTGIERFGLHLDPGDAVDGGELEAAVFTPLAEAFQQREGEAPGLYLQETGLGDDGIRALVGAVRHDGWEALHEASLDGVDEPLESTRHPLDLAALDLRARLAPVRTVPLRIATRLPGFATLFGRALDNLDPVMAAPEFKHPLYEALNRYDSEWLMPGVAAIPQPDMVTALQTNARFVEAFLVGANHEFARELVWREYPTDGRATSLRRFWTTDPDLTSGIDRMRTGPLGSHVDPARAGKLVFIVRGEVVRRFPHLLAAAVASTAADYPVPYESRPVKALFRLAIAPNILLVAVDLTKPAVTAADDGSARPPAGALWFTLAEHVGAPRFGLDEDEDEGVVIDPPKRDDLTWTHWKPTGGHLHATALPAIANDPAGNAAAPLTSAKIAWALFQKPARVGFRARTLVEAVLPEGDGG